LLGSPFVRAIPVISLVVASSLGAGAAHADPEDLNTDAFDLSGALDRDVAPTHRALEVAIGGGYTQGVGGAGTAGSVEDLTGPGGGIELQLGLRATPQWSIALYGTVARFRHGDDIVGVLQESIALRGTSFRDYRDASGSRGNFAERLAAYGRAGEPCLRCGHRLIGTHAIDGRMTVLCAHCQK